MLQRKSVKYSYQVWKQIYFAYHGDDARLFLLTFCLSNLGSVQQMDEEKKGLWKTIMERFSKSPDDAPEKTTEK